MIVKLLTEHHLEFLSLTGGCIGSHESTHVKMPHCWKSHATAHILFKYKVHQDTTHASYVQGIVFERDAKKRAFMSTH